MLPLGRASLPREAGVPLSAPPARRSGGDFAELRRRVRERGLLARRPSAYLWNLLLLAVGAAFCVAVLALSNSLWVQVLNGAFSAFLFTQTGFVMHDAGHGQIFRRHRWNDLVGLLSANLLVGLSYGWWVDKHNRHHGQPNHLDHDPDIDFPVVAFCEEQVLAKKRPWRWIVRYQAFLFCPLLLRESLSLRAGSLEFLVRKQVRHPILEWSLLTAHYLAYFSLVFVFLDLAPALAFIVCSHGLIGVYTGAVFAPNHKGMPIYGRGSRPGYLERQVLTSRNVHSNPVNDFLYGGLNHQVEHHLFPSLQRHRLREARLIVRDFCRERGLAYTETGVLRSYWEILKHLHRVSAPLRGGAWFSPKPEGDSS